jgi:hypothetical protein
VGGIERQEKAIGGRVFRGAFRTKVVVQIQRAGGVIGRANIEQS